MSASIFEEIKKKETGQKKEKLKVVVAIFTTNLLVAMICLNFGEKAPETLDEHIPRIVHANYKMLKLPLKILVENDVQVRELPVTILDQKNKVVIEKAYLHDQVSKNDELGQLPHFKIEISESDLLKINANAEAGMIAVPEVKLARPVVKTTLRRSSSYEVNL